MQALRERFATLSDVERPAADGDFVVIDLTATRDGEVVDGAELTGMSYQVGRGGMIDGLDEALAGMAAGEEKTFTTELVGGDLVGQDGRGRRSRSPRSRSRSSPSSTTTSRRRPRSSTPSPSSTTTSASGSAAASGSSRPRPRATPCSRRCWRRWRCRCPRASSPTSSTRRRQSIEQQLVYAGMTMDAYLEEQGQTQEEFEADLERRVRDAVAAQFVLDEIAKKEELGVDQSELSQHLVRRAQQSGQDPQEFANHMFEHNHIPELVQEILRGKALAQIVETASRHRRVRQPGRAEEPASRTAPSVSRRPRPPRSPR